MRLPLDAADAAEVDDAPPRRRGGQEIPLTLRRVVLRSVGPPDARFDPLTLDMTADQPVTRALWALTNTGGKTTLLRLVYSVIVTKVAAQMGGANIGDFVGPGDTAHVVLEWEGRDGRFVTGAVYEWPGRTPTAKGAMGDLNRWYYTYRLAGDDPVPVEQLPFTTDTGTKRTLSQFRAEVLELFRTRTEARFDQTDNHGTWRETLESQTPLDPTLFQYQMRMNSDEGGADALVEQLTTPDRFVRFFIQALNEDAKLQEFTQSISEYAARAGQRTHMEREATLCAELAAALEMLDTALQAAIRTDEARRLVDVQGGELAASIRGRKARLDAEIEKAADDAAEAERQLAALTTEVSRHEDIRAQLLYLLAQFRADAARDAHDAAKDELERATADAEAWNAVPAVLELQTATEEAAAAKTAYDTAEADLAPLRERVDLAASRLAKTFADLAAQAEGEAKAAGDEHGRVTSARDKARGWELKAQRRANAAAETEAKLRRDITLSEDELRDLRQRGLVLDGETAEAAKERTEHAANDAAGRAEVATETRAEARQARQAHDRVLTETRSQRDAAGAALTAVQARGDENARQLEGLNANEVLTAIAGGPVENTRHAHRLRGPVQARAADARDAHQQTKLELDWVAAQLDALDRDDLLEPHDDIQRVLSALAADGISASGGWAWLAENVADAAERRVVIEHHPDLAGGVVVSANNLGRARGVLADAGLNPLLAIAVFDVAATAQLMSSSNGHGPSRFVVDPHPALYDPERARDLRVELRQQQVALEETAAAQSETVQATDDARALLDGFCRSWAETFDDEHVAALDAARAAEQTAEQELDDAIAHAAQLDAAIGRAETAYDEAHEAKRTSRHIADEVARALPRAQAAADARTQLPDAVEQRSIAEGEVADERAKAEAAEARRDELTETRTRAEGRAQDFRRQQTAVGMEPSDQAGTEPPSVQDAALQELRRGLQERERGSNHAGRLDRANERQAECRTVVDQIDSGTVAAARSRLTQLDSADAHTTRFRITQCNTRRIEAAKAEQTAANDLERAEADLADRAPKEGRSQHVVLTAEWEPENQSQAAAYRSKVEALLVTIRQQASDQAAAKNGLDQRKSDLKVNATLFDTAAQRWTGTEDVPVGSVRPFDGTVDEATAAVDEARRQLKDRTDANQAAQQEASDTFDLMRGAARANKWDGVASTVKETCDKAPRDVVTAHAGEWAGQLRIRERSLLDDLRDLDQYRQNIVVTLHQLTSEQLRLLNQVGNFSKLPPAAGPLAGNPAIKITFIKLPQPEGWARLSALVDTWAADLATREKRSIDAEARVRWLCDAVKQVVKTRADGAAWKVEVLKPTVDGALIYRTPDRIREFSGGQELTLAILVYITLAGVRAANRIGGRRPPVPLLSDNPFGKASNEALIRTQHALAQAADVQLVCASGIDHPDVLAAFEGPDAVILRLRNDRAQRTGMRHLRIVDPDVAEDVQAKVIGGHDVTDKAGYVSATSYQVTP